MMPSKAGLKMKYFVLNPNKKDHYGAASRYAIKAYADCIRGHEPELAGDLMCWVQDIEKALRV